MTNIDKMPFRPVVSSILVTFMIVFSYVSPDDTFARRGGSYYGGRGYSTRGSVRHSSYGRPYQSRPYQTRAYQGAPSYQGGYSASSRRYLESNPGVTEFAGRSRGSAYIRGERSYSRNSIRQEEFETRGEVYVDRRDYRRDVYYGAPGYYAYGYIVPELPVGYQTVNAGGTSYFYDGVNFYLPRDEKFVVVSPPNGAAITNLPAGYTTVYYNRNPYYYSHGTYYVSDYSGYTVTEPPAGLTVDHLPEGFTTEEKKGIKYYVYNNVYYRPYHKDGKVVYMVAQV